MTLSAKHRRKLHLATVALAAIAGLSAAAPAPASIADEAERQFGLCLQSAGTSLPGAPAKTLPPGLGRSAGIVATRVPTATGELYVYRDKGGNQIICGVAVYGIDSAAIEQRLRTRIAAHPDYAVTASGIAARTAHWHLRKAPGVGGIDMVRRIPNPRAPSLEAEVHTILVQ